jgi:hypothetical protein
MAHSCDSENQYPASAKQVLTEFARAFRDAFLESLRSWPRYFEPLSWLYSGVRWLARRLLPGNGAAVGRRAAPTPARALAAFATAMFGTTAIAEIIRPEPGTATFVCLEVVAFVLLAYSLLGVGRWAGIRIARLPRR